MPLLEETPLGDGLNAVRHERDRLDAEITAFEEFNDRIATVIPQPTPSTPTSGLIHAYTGDDDTSAYNTIWTTYRETVLAVDHWAEAYGETTVTESLQNEFSAGLAETLTADSQPPFAPAVKQRLQTEVHEAIRTRTRALEFLTTEVQQLRHLRDQLDALIDDVRPVEHGDESFDQRIQRLATVSQSLEELGQRHQDYVQGRSSHAEIMLTGMVYAELETAYPGLTTIAQIRRVFDRLELRLWAGIL